MQSPKTILVIGGTGFVGRYVVKVLAEQGFRVKVVSRNPSAVGAIKTMADVGQIAFISGDLAQPETILRHVKDAYAVVNLVGILFESGGKQNFNMLHAVGAEKLAQAATSFGVQHFIHMSALGVDRATSSLYAHSKMHGEKAVRMAFPDAVILRPSVMFGSEDNFFNQFAGMAMCLPVLPLIGGGNTKFQPVYVGDVARMMLAAILQPERANGRIFELGGARVMSMKQIMEYILEMTNRRAMLLPISFGAASIMGGVMQLLPKPMLTRDQVMLLKHDNVISGNYPGMEALGISPTSIESVVPSYLKRYRKNGK
jgi:NADH dehydrogenase